MDDIGIQDFFESDKLQTEARAVLGLRCIAQFWNFLVERSSKYRTLGLLCTSRAASEVWRWDLLAMARALALDPEFEGRVAFSAIRFALVQHHLSKSDP